MKRLGHLLLFIAAFQMEVRVRAAESLSFPENCIGKSSPCSFKVGTDKWSYEAGNVKMSAPVGSILTENSKTKEWTLVEGSLWVQNGPSVRVKTISAEVEGSSGQYWIFIEKNKVVFRNISSKLVVTFKDQTKMEIPKGFEVWAGAANSEARIEHGMVEPIDLKSHLKAWHALYPGTRQEFVSEVQDLKDQWSDLIEQSGDIYKKVAERKLAALDEDKQKKIELQKQKDLERKQLREKFHRKVFEY